MTALAGNFISTGIWGTTSSGVNLSRPAIIDTQAPTLGSVVPASLSTILNDDTIAFTVSDDYGLSNPAVFITYAEDADPVLGGVPIMIYSDATGETYPAVFSVTTASNADNTEEDFEILAVDGFIGDFTLTIMMDDVGGNIDSETISYTVSNPVPGPGRSGGGNPETTYLGSGYLGG